MYREGFQKNPLKLVWGENKAARVLWKQHKNHTSSNSNLNDELWMRLYGIVWKYHWKAKLAAYIYNWMKERNVFILNGNFTFWNGRIKKYSPDSYWWKIVILTFIYVSVRVKKFISIYRAFFFLFVKIYIVN